MLRVTIAVIVAATTACASARPGARISACAAGDSAVVKAELYVGRNIPGGGIVSDEQWKDFIERFVTPRLPQGFTVMEGVGQWRNAQGVVERERSMVISVHHESSPANERAIDEIAEEYKRQFRQEAVLRVRSSSCVRLHDQ